MKKLLLAAAALAAFAAPAAAADPEWWYIHTDSDGAVYYARTADLMAGRSHQTDARVWVMTDYSKDATTAYRTGKALFSINCPAQTSRILADFVYMPSGEATDLKTSSAAQYIAPGTIIGAIADMLCSDPTEPPATAAENYY